MKASNYLGPYLPECKAISKQVWDENVEPLVSISCITYNHIDYIRKALDGFLSQETNFKVEILIHDDASTDGTSDIVRDYARRFPALIKPIIQSSNQYSLGVRGMSRTFNYPRANGLYIALCEGDDYWIDKRKLQRQVRFLAENPEYGMIVENALVKNLTLNQEYPFNTRGEFTFTIDDLLGKRQIPTASVVFKRELLTEEIFKVEKVMDTVFWCYIHSKSKIKYHPIISSVYNRGSHGIVESSNRWSWANKLVKYNEVILSFWKNDKQLAKKLKRRNSVEFFNAFKYYAVKGRLGLSFSCLLRSISFSAITAVGLFLKSINRKISKGV